MNRTPLMIRIESGVDLDAVNLKPVDIDINDIASHLARAARWGGAAPALPLNALSVAEHSVAVSRLCSEENALWGLLHDAPEYITGDLKDPFKKRPESAFFRELEHDIMKVIALRYHLKWPMPVEVHRADMFQRGLESRDYLNPSILNLITPDHSNHPRLPDPLSPVAARDLFLDRFVELTQNELSAA